MTLSATAGEGEVTIMNGMGQEVVRLATTTTGEGAVVTMNGKGQELVMLATTITGQGTVTTLNGALTINGVSTGTISFLK